MTRKTLKAFLDKAPTVEDTVRAEYERRLHRMQAQVREAKAVEKRLLDQIEEVEARHDFIAAAKEPTPIFSIKPRSRKLNQAAGLLVASDWHVGEQVDPLTINGLNTYTPDIAEARAKQFFENGLRLVEIQRAGTDIKVAVLALLGDMITGYIHEELVETNPLSPTEEVLLVKKLLISGIDFLLENGQLDKIVVPCCYGNHGRTTPKRRVSSGAKNSFEWLLYRILEDHYAGEDRVEFVVADGSHVYLEVFGYVVRFHHGDDVRYQGGVGGLSIPLRKACDSWDSFKEADLTVIGHWHQLVDYGFALVNGSLIGYGPYALSIKARFEVPQQAFALIDKSRRRKTVVAPILVEAA